MLKRVLELSPGREPALIMTGDALTLLGRYTEAGPAYAKADADDLFRLTGEAILAARTHNCPSRTINSQELRKRSARPRAIR